MYITPYPTTDIIIEKQYRYQIHDHSLSSIMSTDNEGTCYYLFFSNVTNWYTAHRYRYITVTVPVVLEYQHQGVLHAHYYLPPPRHHHIVCILHLLLSAPMQTEKNKVVRQINARIVSYEVCHIIILSTVN